jgi:hypothetical protein
MELDDNKKTMAPNRRFDSILKQNHSYAMSIIGLWYLNGFKNCTPKFI